MKRGSALLIVLGLMAFIVVSAVAFSAYMRYSRLPSSYLRRTSSSRLLVKAALAEAIEQVDAAIGDAPYPGVGGSSREPNSCEDGTNLNDWRGRVFFGATNTSVSASLDETVSTLTVEGLAYIPPPIINEVRYYSRHTPRAQWHTMNYDAGRYAFCAVDVSDFFDVNRVRANQPRSSADGSRITLAHCFENTSHSGYSVQPSVWDSFMDNYLDASGSKVPLVSVADLNLAIWDKEPKGITSPFCEFLKNGTKFVESDDDNQKNLLLRNMAFVTDSLFTPSNVTDTAAVDLARVSDQPFYNLKAFKSQDVTKNADTFDQLVAGVTQKFKNQLSVPEMAQLYDYLDRDSVPLSLALPTTERIPMITGVGLNGSVSLVAAKSDQTFTVGQPDAQGNCDRVQVTAVALSLAGEIGVRVGFVYPFKYSRGNTTSFKAQAAATVTLVPSGSENLLRRATAKYPFVFARSDWTTSKKEPSTAKIDSEEIPVVVTMLSETKNISVKTVHQEEDAILDDVSFNFTAFNKPLTAELGTDALMAGTNESIDDKFNKTTFRKIVKTFKNGHTESSPSQANQPQTKLQIPNATLSGVASLTSGGKYVPVIQVWVRVLDENDKVVDLVPAYYKDDETTSQRLVDIRSAAQLPLLRFYNETAADVELTYDDTVFNYETKTMTPYPQAYLADDPRFNHSPENLLAVTTLEGSDIKAAWKGKQRSSSHDGDLFMATSDAGYMQSLLELSFINNMDLSVVNGTGYNGTIRTSFDTMPANKAMWNTYSQIKVSANTTFDKVSDVFPLVESGSGFRVNPFTSDVNVFMSALANTPMDWWAASTNTWGDTVKQQMAANLTQANKYTFSEFSDDSELKNVKHGKKTNSENTLWELAQNLMTRFRAAGNDWESSFDGIDWAEEDKIAGVDLGCVLHSVDKKYLHAFWRGCFANRQHLFLIFVRAEPMMMGSESAGQTPPQLGARAVALVWRDPTVPKPTGGGKNNNRAPHRTRVLFYRQFE